MNMMFSITHTAPSLNYFFRLLSVFICVHLWLISSSAQSLAPGGPGKDAQWATAGKQAIGTSVSPESKVWFTLANGVMTEVLYPDVGTANVHMLQFVVVNPKTKKVETEWDDANHQIKALRTDSLSFQQINTAKSGEWKITKTYATDVKRDAVLINVSFEPRNKNLNLYVYFDPSIGNSGMGDSAKAQRNVSTDNKYFASLYVSGGKDEITNGFYQVSDGLNQLRNHGKIIDPYAEARDGNVVQLAKIKKPSSFLVSLNFSEREEGAFLNSILSAADGFGARLTEYEKGWADYVKTLPKVDPKYQSQFNMAAMVLKALEDKTVRGANIASPTVPWGGGSNANEGGNGYRMIWSRDLYHVFTAYLAIGDKAAAARALDFLFNIQQKPDGGFPQNSWLDGKQGWGSLQMDEVGYPLIMAWQLGRFDKQTYEKHVKPAADFIVKTGPSSPQERWEERPGYSPSTIAAEIAGLVCAADIAKRNGDTASAELYLKTADDWKANIEKWTATTTGKYGDGNYYLRITQNGKPDAGEKVELNNNAGTFDEREIVDAGFLELVRLGIKPADDPLIAKSVKVIDQLLKVDTPNGSTFYRYNHDGYGEMDDGRKWNWDGKYTGRGRPWPLLAGERGQYELALSQRKRGEADRLLRVKRQDPIFADRASYLWKKMASERLDAMLGFANKGLMIPEQIWDKKEVPTNYDREFVPELKFGEGTGSATPLAWSMAQFIRLAVNLKAGRNLDTPQVVYDRYVAKERSGIGIGATKNSGPAATGLPIANVSLGNSHLTQPFRAKYTIDCSNDERLARTSGLSEYAGSVKISPVVNRCNPGMSEAMFFFKADAKKGEIVGDFNGWKPQGLELKYLIPKAFDPSPITKYIVLEFDPTARVEYKLVVDGKWITDPLNPNKIDNGVGGENSVLTMPDYKPTQWYKDVVKQTDSYLPPAFFPPKEIVIDSKILGDKRKIKVYNPTLPGTKSRASLPVLYVQDGSDYIDRARAIQIQYNLVAARKVKPFIMVFIDPKDRMKEYWANDSWANFVANEVVPEIDKHFKTIRTRDGRALLGASLGGVTSIWTALKHPDVFGRVGGQSNSFWIDDGRVVKELAKLDFSKSKFSFYIDDGTLEGVDDSHKVVALLKDKGYDVAYVEGEAGHNWTAWRDRLADAFIALMK